MNNAELFDELIQAIEAGDIRTVQRELGIGALNFPLDEEITLAADKKPLLSLIDQSGNTLLITAASLQQHSIVDLLIHCGADLNHENQQRDRAVDLAWHHENYATVLLLLQHDSQFPSEFDLDELGSADTDLDEGNLADLTAEELSIRPLANRLLSRFAQEQALLYTRIQQGDLPDVKQFILNHSPSKFYFNQQGRSALAFAVDSHKPEIHAYLKFIGAEFKNQQEWHHLESSLNEAQKDNLRIAQLPYFKKIDDAHLIYLLSKTRTTTDTATHLDTIYSYYKKLSAIPEIDTILKVLYYADTLDIVFDFEKNTVADMVPADSYDAVGLTIPSEGTIYIAAQQSEETLLGTIAHEFMHYVLQLLYHNNSHSYEPLDEARQQQLKNIIRNCQNNKCNINNELSILIDNILQDYSKDNQPAEFSVLISEILATLGREKGIQQILKVIPELLKYHDREILVDCENFVDQSYLVKPKNSIRLLNSYTGDLAAIQSIPVKFNTDEIYHSFLDNDNLSNSPSENVLLVTTANTELSGVNLYQALRYSKKYKFPNSYLWINSANFKRLEQEIKKAFQVGESGLLVITHPMGVDREIENILTITSNSPHKKLIIISHTDQVVPIRRLLEKKLLKKDYREIEEASFTLDKVTPSTCENHLSESSLLQGKSITIRDLFSIPMDSTADDLKGIEVATVRELVATRPDLGQTLPTLSQHNDRYYRDRSLNGKRVIQWRALFSKHSSQLLWAIGGERKNTLLLKSTRLSLKEFTQLNFNQPPSETVITLDEHDPALAKQQFLQLCQRYPTKTIHWLQLQDGNLLWQQSQGSLTILQKYINDSYTEIHSEISLLEDKNKQKVVIFADGPGTGKTTLLTHAAQKIKSQTPDIWVIYLRLNDYQQPFYEQSITAGNSLSTPEQAIQFLTNHLLTFQSALEKRILIDRLRHRGKTFLFIDGFDELMAESQPLAINLLKSLEKTPLEKIWITTRPHLRTLLEDQLGSIAYTLELFSVATAGEILTQIWQGESATSDQFEKIGSYAQALIEKFTHSIKDYSAGFTGQPLQIELLAAAFKEKLQQFLSSAETTPILKERVDLAMIYQQFIEQTYAIQQQEKRGIKAWDLRAKSDFNRLKPSINQDHQRVALLELFPEQTIQNLLPKKSRTPEELGEFGLIKAIQGKPRFIHRTFAEYFVADFLVDQLAATEPSTALIDLFLTDVLLKPNPAIIRAFLNDRFTQQLPSSSWRDYKTQFTALWSQKRLVGPALRDTPLQLAVAEKNKALIDFFLKNPTNPLAAESTKQLLQHQDAYGKGILHQAVETADHTIVQQIIDAGSQLGILDSLLLISDQEKHTVLHWAARINDALITHTMLTAGKPSTQITLIKAKNSSGKTALHLAVLFGSKQVVEALLPRGLDQTVHYNRVAACDDYGQTV